MVMTMMALVVMMAILPMPMMMKNEDPDDNDEDNDDCDGNDGDDDVGGDGGCVKTPTAPDFDLRMASIRPDQPYTSPKNIQCQKSSLLPSTVSMISPTGIYESKH